MIKRFILSLTIIAILLSGINYAWAQPADAGKNSEEYLTKGDAAVLVSATDFMKQKISELLSWTVGYDIEKVNRAKLIPIINYILAVPKAVPPDGVTVLEIRASVDDPNGLKNISGVRADLTGIGKLSNMMLVDNGLWGDAKADDGIFTVQTNVDSKVEVGGKEIAIAVANKKGWLALAKTSLQIAKDPKIISAKAFPESVAAGKGVVLLVVEIDNPGKINSIESVEVNLRQIGGSKRAFFYNDGTHGDKVAGDDVFSLELAVPGSITAGTKKLPVEAGNAMGGTAKGEITINVSKE